MGLVKDNLSRWHNHSCDPLSWLPRIANTFRRIWVRLTYPFIALGSGFRVHYSCELRRSAAARMQFGSLVWLERDVWINIPVVAESTKPVIVLEDGCKVGRRCVISAKNRIHCEKNVIFGPSVLVMDHNHAYEDISIPIIDQGVTEGGTIRIEEGCWIGFGAAIVCNQGELTIGKHSVIGANSVLTKSVPPYSVVSGNPGRVVKHFDQARGQWVLGAKAVTEQRKQN
jgi:acetyltransferase-like isoleucine patch superfamily enzyme